MPAAYLQAGKGSTHGYDVMNHHQVSKELGGPEGHARPVSVWELADRTEEMNGLALVQRATIRTLGSAVAVLDSEGHVKLWNLAAERLLGVPEEEANGHLFWTLRIPALAKSVLQRIRKSLAQNSGLRGEPIAYQLPNGSEGQALVTALPIVGEERVLGSVITFEDVSRMSALSAQVASLKANNGKNPRRLR